MATAIKADRHLPLFRPVNNPITFFWCGEGRGDESSVVTAFLPTLLVSANIDRVDFFVISVVVCK